MAISDAQKAAVTGMCPGAKRVDLEQLIQDAEAGGLTPGTGIDIANGVISIADGGVDTDQLADDAVTGDQLADDAVDTAHLADNAVETAAIADGAVDTDQLADGAVTADKLDSGIALITNPLAGPAAGETLLRKQITLAAANPTSVAIAGADDAATLLGSEDGPFNLTVGNTFIINPNAVGNQTWTVVGTAGTSTGTTGCDEDMSAEPENKLKVAVDGGAATQFTFDWTAGGGCNTGAKVAAQMQTVIQAGGGDYAAVTVAFSTDHYVITSGNKGTASAVIVTPAADHDCSARLKLGTVNGGTEAAGTGDAPILARAAASVVAAKIAALHASLAATAAEGLKVRLNATGTGGASSLVVGNGTENTELGFTNTQADYGNVGMGAGHAMANATYTVVLTPVTNTPANVDVISIYNKATTGFDVYAETPVAIPVEVLVIGVLAT